jgi:adenylate cyclase
LNALPKTLFRWLVVTLAASAAAIGLARTDWHRALENVYYDYWHVFSGKRYEPEHTVFVSMDDETLVALEDDPIAFWAPHFGQIIGVLNKAGVKAVGLDFIYQVSAEGWLRKLKLPDSQISRNYDSPLRAALAGGNVVLITHLVPVKDEARLLLPPVDQRILLPGGLNDLGVANLFPDDDKHVRRFFPFIDPDPAKAGVSFAMQLALRGAGKDPAQAAWEIGGAKVKREFGARSIGFAGPPGTIPTISMSTLLQADAASNPKVQAAKGRIAIIAANNAGTSDRHFTPYSRGPKADQMAGGEVHANIVETILSGRYPNELSLLWEVLYIGALVAAATWLFMQLGVSVGVLAGGALMIAVTVPAYLAFQHNWVLPVAEAQSGLTLSYLMTLGLRLTREERERARTRTMFERYLAKPVVEKLLDGDRRPDLAGEAMTITVLFSDIRGFTTFSEKLNAHEVVEMLNAYFTRVCEPITAEGGTLDKYIGDAVMAEFGSPVPYPDHARRAVRAALGMAREAEAFKEWMRQRFPGRGLAEFSVGIGLHSGVAICGNMGAPMKLDYTAIGDTVNTASRLEGVTKEMQCVIAASQATIDAAGHGVRTGKREVITVKGRAEPIVVYEITSLDYA